MGHFLSLFFAFLQSFFLVNGNNDNLTRPPLVPINRDLYHSSLSFWNIANPTNIVVILIFLVCSLEFCTGYLMEMINGLVHRHPDKLTMETFKSINKGYQAEISVVTCSRGRKDNHDSSKFRILLPADYLEGMEN
ncbi:hypothetical protein CMV_023152 [Castanea mollissima]|uniref:Uncharacterized protein n=1 Tax=Castanea mollissima TaxID=60419 RepID=A0A8J4QQT8_9ROSI|nr:hypothetical protein CMV_023152 [Castanea mollissima]